MEWVRNNKVILLVLLILLVVLVWPKGITKISRDITETNRADNAAGVPNYLSTMSMPDPAYPGEYAPQVNVPNRMVVRESNVSLLVGDVAQSRDSILAFVDSIGGYMVNVNTLNPQDVPTAAITVRVPENRLSEALNFFRSKAEKVVSENIHGYDVTDQYIDLDARISRLEKTIERLESILVNADQVNDITNLTNQIIGYQNQIDNLKGQKISLEKNSELAKITIYLSTDEMSLPYTPSETFRPAVIFKMAVRSLVASLRQIAARVIWIAVYSVIWIPAIVLLMVLKRIYKNLQSKNTSLKQ